MTCLRCGGPTASAAASLCRTCFATPEPVAAPGADPMLDALRAAYAPGPVMAALKRARQEEKPLTAEQLAERFAPGRRVNVDDVVAAGLARTQAAALTYALHRELGDARVVAPTARDVMPTAGGAARWAVRQGANALAKVVLRAVFAIGMVVALLLWLR